MSKKQRNKLLPLWIEKGALSGALFISVHSIYDFGCGACILKMNNAAGRSVFRMEHIF
jgi:hypothetical protein